MEAKLVVIAGKASASEFDLALPTILGRSRGVNVVLGHPLISRQHCELFETDGVLMVRDLGSLNGTFVGEQRITEEMALHPGDLLTVGPFTFRADYFSSVGMTVTGAADDTPDFVIADTASGSEKVEMAPTIDFGPIVQGQGGESASHEQAMTPEETVTPTAGATDDGFDFNWLDEEPETAPQPARPDKETKPAKKDANAATKETTTIPKPIVAKPEPSGQPAAKPTAEVQALPDVELSLDDLPLPDVDGLVDFGGTVQTPHGDNPAEIAVDEAPSTTAPSAAAPAPKPEPSTDLDDDFDFGEMESAAKDPEAEKQSLSGFFKNLE